MRVYKNATESKNIIENTPDWFDSQIYEQLLTEEEIAELESGVL